MGLYFTGPERLHNEKAQCFISAQLNLISSSCSANWDKKHAYFGRYLGSILRRKHNEFYATFNVIQNNHLTIITEKDQQPGADQQDQEPAPEPTTTTTTTTTSTTTTTTPNPLDANPVDPIDADQGDPVDTDGGLDANPVDPVDTNDGPNDTVDTGGGAALPGQSANAQGGCVMEAGKIVCECELYIFAHTV